MSGMMGKVKRAVPGRLREWAEEYMPFAGGRAGRTATTTRTKIAMPTPQPPVPNTTAQTGTATPTAIAQQSDYGTMARNTPAGPPVYGTMAPNVPREPPVYGTMDRNAPGGPPIYGSMDSNAQPGDPAYDTMSRKGVPQPAQAQPAAARPGLGSRPATQAWAAQIATSTLSKGEQIGAGNFGTVNFANSSDPSCPPLVMKVGKSAAAQQELEREAQTYEKAGDHPNLPKCMGMQNVGGDRALLIEAVKGKDMGKTLSAMQKEYDEGTMSHTDYFGAVQFMLDQMLSTVEHLEQKGILHNDLRPDNILVSEDTGDVKLTDFGVAASSGQTLSQFPSKQLPIGAGIVSPDPMSGPTTSKHDVFAVGGTTYQAGEREAFRYNKTPEDMRKNMGQAVVDFSNTPTDEAAIHASETPSKEVAFTYNQRQADGSTTTRTAGSRGERTPGQAAAGYTSEYQKFINALMDPDPSKRPSAAEARAQPFLKDRLLDDDAAKAVLRRAVA